MDRSPLGRLPAELREYIYKLALTSSKPTLLIQPCLHDPLGDASIRYWLINLDNNMHSLALTRTCRQVHNESSDLFFKLKTDIHIMNNPLFGPTKSLRDFLGFIGPEASSRIRSVKIDMSGPRRVCSHRKCNCTEIRQLVELRRWSLQNSQVALSVEFRFHRRWARAIIDVRDLAGMHVSDVRAQDRDFMTSFKRKGEEWIEKLRMVKVEEEG